MKIPGLASPGFALNRQVVLKYESFEGGGNLLLVKEQKEAIRVTELTWAEE